MMNKWKQKFSNEKGFTLVEILVVIVIIGILFTVILPRIDSASDNARQTGVKTDFRTFAAAAEQQLRETAGKIPDETGLNNYLDKALKITNTGVANTFVSKKEDPWGVPYTVRLDAINKKITVESSGKTGDPANPDFVTTSYYYKGYVDMCTDGLGNSNIKMQSFILTGECGSNVSPTTP